MTLTTFLIWIPILILLALIIKNYWRELFVIYLIVQIITIIIGGSLTTAFLWYLFFGESDKWEGFKILWLFHGIAWILGVGVYLSIVFDLVDYGVQFIRYIFKIK